ncbi:hypothetical protein VTK73DRAFT_7485 [Phialemonium thermophilum]|uniref:Uncharacterized protein n=1 Tax=Phialemonium thermophilum TaxID=223376 RepID=A0ABR3XTH3_9PEZI
MSGSACTTPARRNPTVSRSQKQDRSAGMAQSNENEIPQDLSSNAGDEVYKTPMERKHIVFDDNDFDSDPFVTPLERPLKGSDAKQQEDLNDAEESRSLRGRNDSNSGEEDEQDDDDAAPEAVSTRLAVKQSIKLEQAAARAAESQAVAKKRKRRERDALFKKQAEARRKALDKLASNETPNIVPPSALIKSQNDDRRTEPDVQPSKRIVVPDILPPELLESDDEKEQPESTALSSERTLKRPRLGKLDKEPSHGSRVRQDKTVGSTILRVITDEGSKTLPPRVNRQSRNVKEQLQIRRRAAKRRGGFLVKR